MAGARLPIVTRKGLLIRRPALGGCLGTQPQSDVLRLHRLPDYPNQIFAEGAQVRLVPELRRERFEGLPRVVFSPIEATVYERLYAPPRGSKRAAITSVEATMANCGSFSWPVKPAKMRCNRTMPPK